ncbi:hypothetical protein [Streptomyces sp. Ru73]|uniref:hypothetical protein n=1 Tax=Streptomyces sp. Ru73 TaxID=2080748 RepID=UPI0011AFF610|nr:hypothetical protein [Streptomyces sp. Ru73]
MPFDPPMSVSATVFDHENCGICHTVREQTHRKIVDLTALPTGMPRIALRFTQVPQSPSGT